MKQGRDHETRSTHPPASPGGLDGPELGAPGLNGLNEPRRPLNESTREAQRDTILSPRFYTTDFEAMSKLDVSGVRAEWDGLIAELRADTNRGHFIRTDVFDADFSSMPPELRREFLEFPGELGDGGVFPAACSTRKSRSVFLKAISTTCSRS